MHILIAEDEAIVARDLAGLLEDFGHTVVGIADTVADVLASVAALRPDMVLLDIHLHGMSDGIVAGQYIHDHFQIPVIYLTAHTDAATVQRAALTEPFGYLTKPFNEQSLQSTLEVASYKHQMEQTRQHAAATLAQANSELTAAVAALEQRTHDVAVLSALGGALLRCATIEACYVVIAQAARQLFAAFDGALYIQRAHPPVVEAVAVWGTNETCPAALAPAACWALQHGSVFVEAYPDQVCACTHAPCAGLPAPICVPLVVDTTVLALLQLRFPDTTDRTSSLLRRSKPQQLARALAEQATLGLANVRMRIALSEQVVRDPLTGLFNRRYLEETLAREQHRAARQRHPIGIIFLDIDHFKQVNDTWGHAAGDIVLRVVSRLLLANIRAEDVACRYGGEEFVLILPSAAEDITFARAELIRQQVQALQIVYEGTQLPPISISAGLAIMSDSTVVVAEVLRRADAALYQAKHAGRNRTVKASMALDPIEV
jgi:diguanylate cyclase (GGDEF)-like protein